MWKYFEAIADYDKAIRLAPNYAAAYSNRGLTKREMGHETAAQKDFSTALKLAKETSDTELITWIEGLIEQR